MSRLLDAGIAATAEDLETVLGAVAHDVWARKLGGRFVDVRDGESFELIWNGYGEALICKRRREPQVPAVRPELALIGCSAMKLSRPALARELYRGHLFRLAVRWCEVRGMPWVVLSAEHGVLEPDQVVEPYDRRLPTNWEEMKHWIWRVNWSVWNLAPYGRLWMLCGQQYARAFHGHLHDRALPHGRPFDLVQPLAGLGIGEQKAWLKRGIDQEVQPRLFA